MPFSASHACSCPCKYGHNQHQASAIGARSSQQAQPVVEVALPVRYASTACPPLCPPQALHCSRCTECSQHCAANLSVQTTDSWGTNPGYCFIPGGNTATPGVGIAYADVCGGSASILEVPLTTASSCECMLITSSRMCNWHCSEPRQCIRILQLRPATATYHCMLPCSTFTSEHTHSALSLNLSWNWGRGWAGGC